MKAVLFISLLMGCALPVVKAQGADTVNARKILGDIVTQRYRLIRKMIDANASQRLGDDVFLQIRRAISADNQPIVTGDLRFEGVKLLTHVSIQIKNTYGSLDFYFNSKNLLEQVSLIPPHYMSKTYKDPDYKDTTAIIERDIFVQSGPFILPGTLTIPKGSTNYPLLVFVHGSGSNNRDEALGVLKPFRDMALGLAAKGIASLRYDKRNKVYYKASLLPGVAETMAEETTDDASSAIRLAYNLPGVNKKRVFVIGHSQGGMMIPQITLDNKQLAGGIIMSGPAVPLLKSYEDQYHRTEMDSNTRSSGLKQIAEIRRSDSTTDKSKILLGHSLAFWTDIQKYNQLKTVKKVRQPLLLLQGQRDFQVNANDAGLWVNAVNSDDRLTVRLYPKLNHFYTEGEGAPSGMDYYHPANVPRYVIDDIAEWIKKH